MRLIYFFVLLANLSFSQTKTKVYFLPGQGSDEREFSKIVLDKLRETLYQLSNTQQMVHHERVFSNSKQRN